MDDNSTFPCFICRKLRPEDKITAHTKPLILGGVPSGEQNIWHCSDNTDCVAKAKTAELNVYRLEDVCQK